MFPPHLERQEDTFGFWTKIHQAVVQFPWVYKQLQNKKEWGKVMLKTRKGWLAGRESQMSRVWISASSSNRST